MSWQQTGRSVVNYAHTYKAGLLGSTPSRVHQYRAGSSRGFAAVPDGARQRVSLQPADHPGEAEGVSPVPRHFTAFLSYGAADDLPGYPVVLMHGAAPGDVLAAMD